ncbi:hypothetical protein Pyn_01259 [Prunus yedoensis var. nudiflora]|uniref:Uncharacterized protein n=1 Tax=Prunus yedoensis var. nudiflora TaxID=2094558 RepID=A0A314XSL1_PRUYE|nr:hypothetical protein Pyn_01259 [Prunus yedoensis var. nudiflora]
MYESDSDEREKKKHENGKRNETFPLLLCYTEAEEGSLSISLQPHALGMRNVTVRASPALSQDWAKGPQAAQESSSGREMAGANGGSHQTGQAHRQILPGQDDAMLTS